MEARTGAEEAREENDRLTLRPYRVAMKQNMFPCVSCWVLRQVNPTTEPSIFTLLWSVPGRTIR